MTILWYRFCRKNIFLNTSSDKKLQNYRKVIESNQLTLNYFDQPLPVGNLRTRLNSKFNLEVSFNYSSFLQFSLSLTHTHTHTFPHSLFLHSHSHFISSANYRCLAPRFLLENFEFDSYRLFCG